MPQQEMNFEEAHRDGPQAPYTGYEGTPPNNYSAGLYGHGQKLSVPEMRQGQGSGPFLRLVLALVSLVLLMMVIFGLILVAVDMRAPDWAVIPVLMIILLFGAVVAIINVAFNRSH